MLGTWWYISNPPARQASKPRSADFLPQTYSAEETSRLLNLLHGQALGLPVVLALVFGLRRSEVVRIRPGKQLVQNHSSHTDPPAHYYMDFSDL